MMKNIVLFFFFFALVSCKKEDQELNPSDDNELITSVELEFDDVNSNNDFTIKALDREGDGIFESIEPITLSRNRNYDIEISVFDDTKANRLDITEDIEEESDVHLFIYRFLPSSIGSVHSLNKDSKGFAFGKKAKISTNSNSFSKSQGAKFQVLLKHQPPVNGKAVKNGDENIGSTDIDLTFDLIVN